MPDYSDPEVFLTPDTAGEKLRKSPATIRWYIREGMLPATRIGRRLYIHRDDLARLIEQPNAGDAAEEDDRVLVGAA